MNNELANRSSTAPSLHRRLPFIEIEEPAPRSTANEVAGLWQTLVEHKATLLKVGLIAAALAALLAFALPSTYKSTIGLLIEMGRPKILSIEDLRQGGENREHFQAQAEILQSRDMAIRAVRALKLWDEPSFDPRKFDFDPFGKILASIPGRTQKNSWTEDELADAAAEQLMTLLKIESLRLSGTIRLTIETPDAALSAKILNTLAQEYLNADREARSSQARSVSTMLGDRIASLRDKLTQSEAELQKFREANGIVKMGTTQQSMIAQRLNGVSDRLIAAQARRIELEGAYQQIRKGGTKNTEVGAVQRDPGVAAAKIRVENLTLKLAELSQNLGSEYVTVRETRAQLTQAKEALEQQKRSVINSIVSDYEAALAGEREMRKTLDGAKVDAQGVNRAEFQLAVLEREVESNRQMYEMFWNRTKETSMSAEVQADVARIIDRAVAAPKASGPKRSRIVLMAFMLAVSLTAFFLLIRRALDRTFTTAEQAEQKLNQPILAALPTLPRTSEAGISSAYMDQPRTEFAEAIRTTRTGVLLSSVEVPNKVILVTSTASGEGKTAVATNLAMAYSMTRRTLLIDANLRRPRVGVRLGLRPDVQGLTNLVGGGSESADCFHKVPKTKLRVLPVGNLSVNPQELFLSRRFAQMLDALSQRFEIVIIDSPAVGPASDALVLSSMASCTVVVVKAGKTAATEVNKTIERLRRTGTKVLGVVLNGVTSPEPAKKPGKAEVDVGYEKHHDAYQPETVMHTLDARPDNRAA